MIAVTDIDGFNQLQIVENTPSIFPLELDIISLIGSDVFINDNITTAFKNLLIDISNQLYDITIPTSSNVRTRASQMFNRIGFYYDTNGDLAFVINDNALDSGTQMIIDDLNDCEFFQEIAYNAFHPNELNNWAQEANNIRAIENTGLQKLHYITVYSNSNANTSFNYVANINNQINTLNLRNQNTERFLIIGFDNDTDANPEMPTIRLHNNSDVQIKYRIKVQYSNYVNPAIEGGGAFGPAIPNDNNQDGNITANERVHLNRRFLDYFPNQANSTDVEGDIFSRVLQTNEFWDVDFDDRIRGGEVIIEYFPEPENVNFWNEGDFHYFKFHIRGKNPSYLQLRNYLNNQNYITRFWFMIRKLRHECGAVGLFNGIPPRDDNYEFRHFDRVTNINQYNHRKNSDNGLPVFGFPRGYGISQLDNFDRLGTTEINNLGLTNELSEIQNGGNRELQTVVDNQGRTIDFSRMLVASDQQVWHWKENIDKAVWFLENDKMNITINKIDTIRDRVVEWNTAHPTDLVVVPTPEYYNSVIYCWTATAITELIPYNNLFNQGTAPTIINQGTRILKSFFDAMLLKTYNGLGDPARHFLEINAASSNSAVKPVLTIHNSTTANPFYVRNLSNRDD